ncbi:MAG: hypothetical protein SGI72_13575 [Planctomycetota bacterium]|nr:hypothetical protein [Planctomycetota bacterium]
MPQPQKRGRASKNGLTYGLLALLVLVAAGLTWRFGFPDHFSSVFASEKKKDDHPGKIAVLISPVPIPAFTAIDPATFINPQTGDFFVAYVTEKTATDGGLIRDPAAMRGRVLKRDKGANLAFSEGDFYERGAQASLTSALLPGQRSVTLNATEIEGLRSLKRFDRFDLYAVKAKPQVGSSSAPGYLSPEAAKAAEAGQEWSTDRLVIALNARILVPVPDAKNAKNADNVEVAMTIDEATALADAKARGAKILCWGSTGLPGGDSTKFETPVDPITVDTIQVITGDKSTTTSVPKTPEHKP